jgi:hypothetical protein
MYETFYTRFYALGSNGPGNNRLQYRGRSRFGRREGVTVTLSNAGGADSHTLFVYIYAEGETDVNNSAQVLATNNAVISDGTASVVLKEDDGNWEPTGTDWTGTDGTTYDIYIYTDSDGDSDMETGTVYMTDPFPGTVTIDGNQTVNIDFGDMVLYTPGPV